MAAYLIAQLKFTDLAAYRRYQAAFPAVFRNHAGKVLAADEAPLVLEGEWPRDKVVVMEFADEAAAQAFATDPAYQEISKDRRAGSDAVVLLVRGLT